MSFQGLDAWSLPPVSRIGPDQVVAVNKATPAVVVGNIVNATIVFVSFPTARARDLLELPGHFFANGAPNLRDLIAFNAQRGEFGAGGNLEQVVNEKLALARERKTYHFERTRPNGTVLDVRGAPAGEDGFVTTYIDVTERYQSQAQILHLAEHDPLTDLANRTRFHAHLEQTLHGAGRGGRSFALLVFDLDRFKEVNDTFGHPMGDKLLKLVADRTRDIVRNGDMLARLGGDEFALVASTNGGASDAAALAERICAEIRQPFSLDGLTVSVGVSIGIAMGPADGQSVEDLVKNADLALYRAKALGGCGYCFFETAMDADMRARRQLEADLSQALSRDEFELYYQPLLTLATTTVCAFEALLRYCAGDARAKGWCPRPRSSRSLKRPA